MREKKSPEISTPRSDESVTKLLDRVREGDEDAQNKLVLEVYRHLYKHARQLLQNEPKPHTAETTLLLDDAMLIALSRSKNWNNSSHFFRYLRKAMKMLVLSYARKRKRKKRGGTLNRLPFERLLDHFDANGADIEAFLKEHLEPVAAQNANAAEVFELHFLFGFTFKEIGKLLGIDRGTATQRYQAAQDLLRKTVAMDLAK
jgi:RNA polymerase sigma factor (TIGR02999 family)